MTPTPKDALEALERYHRNAKHSKRVLLSLTQKDPSVQRDLEQLVSDYHTIRAALEAAAKNNEGEST